MYYDSVYTDNLTLQSKALKCASFKVYFKVKIYVYLLICLDKKKKFRSHL